MAALSPKDSVSQDRLGPVLACVLKFAQFCLLSLPATSLENLDIRFSSGFLRRETGLTGASATKNETACDNLGPPRSSGQGFDHGAGERWDCHQTLV